MREILFRGKGANGKWMEGSLVKVTINGLAFQLIFADDFEFNRTSVKSKLHCCVDPSTIGQYTGLTDKNGKKIFEGDIVRRNATPMVVAWDSFDGNFITECFIDDVRCVNTLAGHSKLEVIGNIYDNPELLEVDNGT